MRLKRWLALLLSAALVLTLMAGCGGGGGGGTITTTPLIGLVANELQQNTDLTVEDKDLNFDAAVSNAVNLHSTSTSDPDAVADAVRNTLLTSYNVEKVPFSDQLKLLGSTGSKAVDVTYLKDTSTASVSAAVRQWKEELNQFSSTAGSCVCSISIIKKGDYYYLAICVTVAVPDTPGSPDQDNEQEDQQDDESYIHIQTAQDLLQVARRVNNGEPDLKIKLDNNIDLGNQSFTPMGSSQHPFTGIFDGDGHAIQGLKVNLSGGAILHGGLFSDIGTGGVVENLTIQSPQIQVQATTYACAGAIVGYNDGGTIQNCKVSGGTVSGQAGSSAYVGGIAGNHNGPGSSNITNCTVSQVKIQGTSNDLGSYVGGIAGITHKTITGCSVVGAGIKAVDQGHDSGQLNAGGIAGTSVSGTIQSCTVSSSPILAESKSTSGNATTEGNAGGIVGYNNGAGIIANCKVASSQMTAAGKGRSNAGGLVGVISLTGSSITGSTVSQGCLIVAQQGKEAYAGGLVGHAGAAMGTIGRCDVSGGRIEAFGSGTVSANALVGDHPEFVDGYYGCTVQGNPTIVPNV